MSADDNWRPTDHDGILCLVVGTRMYGCTKCDYVNSRLYHAKMHHQRIHVQNGRGCACRRKFEGRSGASMPVRKVPVKEPVIAARSKKASSCRKKISAMRRVATTEDIGRRDATTSQKNSDSNPWQNFMTFGASSVEWTVKGSDVQGNVVGLPKTNNHIDKDRVCALREMSGGFRQHTFVRVSRQLTVTETENEPGSKDRESNPNRTMREKKMSVSRPIQDPPAEWEEKEVFVEEEEEEARSGVDEDGGECGPDDPNAFLVE